MNTIGTLYIVATPIGNLEDITLRALRVLAEVDCILCEDTRTTGVLLSYYKIKNKLKSYHANSTKSKESEIIKMLKEGQNIALVSDAGTPTISDPGVMLVAEVYEHFGHDAHVVSVPGASAFVSALSISGVSSASFVYLGFLPHKKGRETLFKEIQESKRPCVFYESTHRMMKTLESLHKYSPIFRVTCAREITKKFEQVVKGTPSELLAYFKENKEKQKGEFVFIVEPL